VKVFPLFATVVPPVSLIRVVHFDLQISPQIFEKIQNDPYAVFRGMGEMFHEKIQKQKIS
jgi:hypothetical protein